MLTSSRNWSSGSAAHSLRLGADAPMVPAVASAMKVSAVRPQSRIRPTAVPPSSPDLAEDRLGFGERDRAGVAALDEIDGDRTDCGPGKIGIDRNGHVPDANLGVDGDAALDRD